MTETRHGGPGPDDQAYAQSLGEGLLRTISFLEEAPEMFDGALDTAMLHVQARLAVNPDASDLQTWEAVVTAMQVGSAMFSVAGRSEGTVECRIADKMRTPAGDRAAASCQARQLDHRVLAGRRVPRAGPDD